MKMSGREMKVFIATGSYVLSEGLKQVLLKNRNGYKITAVNACVNSSENHTRNPNDKEVILTDYITLKRLPEEFFVGCNVLVLDNGLEKESVVTLFLTRNIAGLVHPDSSVDLLLKAIKVVSDGGVWVDNPTVKMLLEKKSLMQNNEKEKLTERENTIIKLVADGYRNKEIAAVLSISEQTVKSHLNRIFRKFNISSRTELISRVDKRMIQ